jgi:hypothetical protein
MFKNAFKIALSLLSILVIVGCGLVDVTKKVSYLGDRSIQFDDNKNEIILFFSLKDKDEKVLKSPATVDIRIINDENEQVYNATKKITESDFGTWTSALRGSQTLASIYIPISSIKKGKSDSGKIHFKVYHEGSFEFDESTLSTSDLPYISPVDNFKLSLPEVPKKISYISSWDNKIQHTFNITNISYKVEESYDLKSVELYIYFSGEKTYDVNGSNNSDYGYISWRIIDKEGFVIETGNHFTSDLKVGDKFKDAEEWIYDLAPGEYILEIMDKK